MLCFCKIRELDYLAVESSSLVQSMQQGHVVRSGKEKDGKKEWGGIILPQLGRAEGSTLPALENLLLKAILRPHEE